MNRPFSDHSPPPANRRRSIHAGALGIGHWALGNRAAATRPYTLHPTPYTLPPQEDFMSTTKRVWLFEEGNATMRDLLGGKGANLCEMTNIGLPVPPGFTITTETCMD